MALRVGVDIGGTFTDLAVVDEETGATTVIKVPSTPGDYARAVIDALSSLTTDQNASPEAISFLSHATTVVTNAILESKGARIALITTRGFRDVLEIRRQARAKLYDVFQDPPAVLVPRHMRLEVTERINSSGQVLTPLDSNELSEIVAFLKDHQVQAVAVCLLFSFLNSEHERLIGEVLRRELPDVRVFLSSEVLPEVREYERTSTTAVCAYVAPILESYLNRLREFLVQSAYPPLYLMGSRGGVLTVDEGLRMPAMLVESGPAAGVIAAAALGDLLSLPDVISFDMGGTTAKASLIENGEVSVTTEYEVGGGGSLRRWLQGTGYPIKVPVVDLSEVSAGGGSIAWVDDGGGLRVGPHSAGALPGPACYGAGGQEPTVTDADLTLGYLNPHRFLAGKMVLSSEGAAQAIQRQIGDRLGLGTRDAAQGIVDIVTAGMSDAIRKISIERGHDTRSFTLVAFGGAGPVHAGRLAQELGINTVVIPPNPGVFSAVGLVCGNLERDYVRTFYAALVQPVFDQVKSMYKEMEKAAMDMLARSGVNKERWEVRYSMDLRYPYQAYELNIPVDSWEIEDGSIDSIADRFHQRHLAVYGHNVPEEPVHLVNLRITAVGRLSGTYVVPRVRKTEGSLDGALTGGRDVFFRETGTNHCPVYERDRIPVDTHIQGPAIIEEPSSTIVIYPGQYAMSTEWGTITIRSHTNTPA